MNHILQNYWYACVPNCCASCETITKVRRVSQIEGTIHKGCVFFVPYPEKKRTFLHFFVLTPAFWEFKAVILQRISKITCLC